METIWTVTVYNELGKVVDYASFSSKAEASIYGRSVIGTDYRLNFTIKKIER